MKSLKLVKLRKSNKNRYRSRSCKTLKNTNSIVNLVTLILCSRIPTTSIAKQNNVSKTGKKSENLKKTNDSRLN